MKHFEIKPHIGVGPIKLGMARSEVESLFGTPEFEGDGRVGYLSGFCVDFDGDGKVEFIELANSQSFEATYKGKNLHELKAKDAVALIEIEDSYDKSNPELGHSYIFKKLQLSLWRGTLPENEQDTDGQFFEAVGVATEGYF